MDKKMQNLELHDIYELVLHVLGMHTLRLG